MPDRSIRDTAALPDLRGRVALVTGGSMGIGRAVVSALARSGAAVAIVARDKEALHESRAAVERDGGRAIDIAGTVEDREFCFRAVERVERELGSLDVLVNAAGIQGPIGPLHELDPEAFERTVRVNLLGTVWMMQAALAGMMARRKGVVVNFSGGGATTPRERFTAYAASKTAVVRLSEIAAHEYAEFGIRVNAISPGAVRTRMTEEMERAGERAGTKTLQELKAQRESGGGGVDPALPAQLVAWLASDAAAHVTGRLVSAVWDDWRGLIARGQPLDDPDALTLRRR